MAQKSLSGVAEWQPVLLDHVAVRGTGHTPSKSHPEYWNGGIKWVSLQDSGQLDCGMITSTAQEISALGVRNSSAVVHPRGTVVLCRDAAIGRTAVLGEEMAVSQHFIAWQCGPRLNNWFLYFYLQSLRREFERVSNGSTIKTVGMGHFERLLIPLPSLEEQAAIVEVLQSAVTAANVARGVIEKKVFQKQTIGEELLTGGRRLPGFSRPWYELRLGDAFAERIEANREDLKLLSVTGSDGVVDRDTLVKRDTSSEDKSKYLRVCPGDIAYNTMRMWQGVFGLSTLEGIVSPAYTVCTPNPSLMVPSFVEQFFKLPHTISLFRRYSQGLVDDTLNLKFHNFAEIKVTVPDVDEQAEIARVLKDLDQEIGLLCKQRDALNEQKKGLMQKLLTGEVRLKEFRQ